MTTLKCVLAGTLVLGGVLPALGAGPAVDERRPAASDARVEIEDVGGSIKVEGWDQQQVEVTGSVRSHRAELKVTGSGRLIRVSMEGDGHPSPEADLLIRVPAGASVDIDSFSAEISISGIKGTARAQTVNGSITSSGGSEEVDVETVNGSLDVSGPARRVHAESVNGRVSVRGTRDEVDASTVNGSLVVEGGTFRRTRLETVNGDIRFEGDLGSGATMDVESVGGGVELRLPTSVGASFSVASFSGDIQQEFTGDKPRKTSRWTSEVELNFTTGSGGARVNIHTLSGDVLIRKK
jgi:DUF4097 and DUF4098 domain-containing protein YvlB